MSRFLLDMGIAQSSGEFLTICGHEVVHLVDQGLERLADEGIVEKARREKRTIVTHDLDFGRIVALSGGAIPSVVTLRLSDMRPDQVNAALQIVLREAGEALDRGALVSVTDIGIRIRPLPVDAD